MEQYPDSIVISWKDEPTQSASGDYTEGGYTIGASGNNIYSCRAEINTKAQKIIGSDGQLIDFTQMIYMPLITVNIPINADYILNGTIFGKVKRASNGQLNSRLWL
jgi:hypothetical protein